jgi:hypothetical protein
MSMGVTFGEDQRKHNSFSIRIGGSNDYISSIDPNDSRCSPPGSVETVEGRNHPDVMKFATLDEAVEAGGLVFSIEGFHNSIESELLPDTGNPITVEHLEVYFCPEWESRDGNGFCVDNSNGSTGHRFPDNFSCGAFICSELERLKKEAKAA